jgi:hypothetical protein
MLSLLSRFTFLARGGKGSGESSAFLLLALERISYLLYLREQFLRSQQGNVQSERR